MTEPLLVAAAVIAVVAAVRGMWSPCGLSVISALNPLAERARGNRYWVTTIWFAAGSVAGGALLGAVAAAGAWLLRPVGQTAAMAAAAAACLVTAAADMRLGGLTLPIHPRQLNEQWLGRYRRWVYASGFGFQIGTGFATYIMTAATYLLVALAALSGSPIGALGVGVLFGGVRGLAVLPSAAVGSPDALLRLHRRLDRLEPWTLRLATIVQFATALLLGVAIGSVAGGVVAGVIAVLIAAGAVIDRQGHRWIRTPELDQPARI